MRPGRNIKRRYWLIVGCFLMAGVYYVVVTLPLIRSERELDQRLLEASDRLASAGHGMSVREVTRNIEALEADIDSFSTIGSDRSRTIRFSNEVEEILRRPFQLMDFEHRKYLVIDGIRREGRKRKVKMFDNWEQNFPAPGSRQPYQLWAGLAAMDQLLRTAIAAGVDSIDGAEIVSAGGEGARSEAGEQELEVSVRMQLTGQMEAIHSVIMMLPLNGEELEDLDMIPVSEPKSSFFINRFILKKSSAKNPNEVTFDFVASGFLEGASGF